MEIKVLTDNFYQVNTDALVVPIYEDEAYQEGLGKELDEATGGVISSLFERKEFKGKANETAYIHLVKGLKARRLLLVGVGKQAKVTNLQLRQAAGTVARFLRTKKVKSLAFLLRDASALEQSGEAIAEGALLSTFDPDTYKTRERDKSQVEEFFVLSSSEGQAELEKGLAKGKILADSTNFSRNLVNEPSSNLTPKDMASKAEQVAREANLAIEILDEEKMKELGMGAILGVSRGSAEEARLIVLRYEHPEASPDSTIALIGKGITFDSGGISIKPSEGMEKMKGDMAGAAAVMGAMRALGQLKPKARVVGVMACAENMPSGTAIKPGDVLTAMSGQTIEVVNTDAEGRLVLADAITYAREKLGATKMVDLATLTGAVGIALGPVYTAILGTCQDLIDQIISTGSEVGERFWQLPLDEEYGEQLQSDIADLKNSGGRPAGTITGAYFIKEFTGNVAWAHLDIASTAVSNEKKPYLSKGATGVGIRTLVAWVMSQN
ncbi:MAG: leucyl aminopeptidase [Acidobacteria bacterium]|nr:leucyl aminopeptidase [Acidobacteriota bacterium]